MTEGCVFCDHDRLREADLFFENDFCIYSSTRDRKHSAHSRLVMGGAVR